MWKCAARGLDALHLQQEPCHSSLLVTATLQQRQSRCQEHKQKGQEVKCDLWATVRRKPRAPQSTSGDTWDISQQLLRDSCTPR